MVRTALEWMAIRTTPSTLREIPFEKLEAKDISIAAAQGDFLAKEIMNYTGDLLGKACADFWNFSSPEAFVFFGGPTKAGDLLMNPIRKAYDENVLMNFKGKAKLLLSELDGSSAAVLGASALGWEL
jgi:glucokinase